MNQKRIVTPPRPLVCKNNPRCRRPSTRVVSSTASRRGDARLPPFHPPRPPAPGPLPRSSTRALVSRAHARIVCHVSLVRLVVHEASAAARRKTPTMTPPPDHGDTTKPTPPKTNVRYLVVVRLRAREESRRVGRGVRTRGGGDLNKNPSFKTNSTDGIGWPVF